MLSMKFTVTLKDPDALDNTLIEYPENKRRKLKDFAGKFLDYGEYITVEFDTEKKTAIVLKR